MDIPIKLIACKQDVYSYILYAEKTLAVRKLSKCYEYTIIISSSVSRKRRFKNKFRRKSELYHVQM